MTNDQSIIKEIGEWFRLLSNFDLRGAADKRVEVCDLLSSKETSKQVKDYFHLVDFRHKVTTGEIIHRPVKQKELKSIYAITETDRVLEYLYHYMEGFIHFNQDNYKIALKHYRVAEKSLHKANRYEQAEFYYRFGASLYRIDQNIIAMNYINEAYEIFKTSDNHQRRRTNCLVLMACIQSEAKSFHKASQLFEHTLELSAPYPYMNSLVLRNRGLHEYRQGFYEVAKHSFYDALHTGNQSQTIVGEKTKYNLANIYLKLGDIEKGLLLLNEVEQEFRSCDLNEYIGRCMVTRGLYAFEDINIDLVDKGIEVFDQNNLYFQKGEVTEEVSNRFNDKKAYDQALKFMEISKNTSIEQTYMGIVNI
ncbi:hypothetical protein ACE1TF_10260 [Geomicrobium sp. JSM 1781026]|uniref:response regulator aspartate phosphatase n=1 Tax=Geomicrobium sp. JSM 1781026 TaxID=3344580 RepID=UPI0035C15C92